MLVLDKYPQYQDIVESPNVGEPGLEAPPEQKAANALQMVGQGMAVGELGANVGRGILALPEALSGGISGIRAGLGRMLTTPASAGASPAMIRNAPALAKALPDVLTAPEQGMTGLGESVAQAARSANAPETTQALVTRGAGDIMQEPIQPSAPGVRPNTNMFQQPISRGLGTSAEQIHQVVKARGAMLGDAIGNTLEGLDKSGSQFDAKPLLDKINGMYQRSASGDIATEGVQGEANQAISEALETIKNEIDADGRMTWKGANRAKSLLQDSGNYAAKRYDMANEAYKNAASAIKEEIDDQGQRAIGITGGNIQQFQQLRQAYAQTKFAEQSTANAAAKEIGGGSLAQRVGSKLFEGAKAAVLPYALYKGLK
jgi:hypothetical protein